ncbi:hypothetical protein DFA_02924 [Cavenderia fasciculata]|uniref:Uncharacterized protein n=1 Tax=Cavenderia fasciculata TaxID=261658 RepID=F4PG46_CACFS|nr:uncharacterized protein DFA_02924 [Cavenderia fasciculata]EGG24680.1 hypothetical protein DFA_02924 [Cavenderia fasciculata]|eukprot:XP_004362531.1 hypothetical protein DFA_02924 [Cavenderia fasciculata]
MPTVFYFCIYLIYCPMSCSQYRVYIDHPLPKQIISVTSFERHIKVKSEFLYQQQTKQTKTAKEEDEEREKKSLFNLFITIITCDDLQLLLCCCQDIYTYRVREREIDVLLKEERRGRECAMRSVVATQF